MVHQWQWTLHVLWYLNSVLFQYPHNHYAQEVNGLLENFYHKKACLCNLHNFIAAISVQVYSPNMHFSCLSYRVTKSPHTHILYFFDQRPWLLFILLPILYGYYSRVAFISLDINYGWIRYVQVRRWRLLDTVSGTRSLSILLSAVGTTQTALVLAWWLSLEIIRTCVCIPHLLAIATIRGWHLFHSELRWCGYYSRVVIIRGWRLIEEIRYIHMCMHTYMHSHAHTHTPVSFTVRKHWQQPHVSTQPITLIPCTFVSIPSSLHFCTIIWTTA